MPDFLLFDANGAYVNTIVCEATDEIPEGFRLQPQGSGSVLVEPTALVELENMAVEPDALDATEEQAAA